MTFDFSKWMGKYGDVAPDESIEYKDSSGTWNEETDYQYLTKRPQLTAAEP